MSQPLNINVKISKNKGLSIYYHNSGNTCDAVSLLAQVYYGLLNSMEDISVQSVYDNIIQSTYAKVHKSYAIDFKTKHPSLKISYEDDVDRNSGLILAEFSYNGILEAELDLENKTVSIAQLFEHFDNEELVKEFCSEYDVSQVHEINDNINNTISFETFEQFISIYNYCEGFYDDFHGFMYNKNYIFKIVE